MSFTHIHTPIALGPAKVKNRVFRSAHGTALGGGTMSEDLIAYHLARAKGGVGLTILEILSVHPTTPGPLNVFMPGIDDGYRRLIDQIRPTGMTTFQQLWHAGNQAQPIDGSPPWSASDVPGLALGAVPQAMTKAMIDEIVGAFAAAAAKCEAWGLDGVEVHCAHGYLVQQFLAPFSNTRTDEYGGSFENRARFMVEVMTAVRGAVSPDFAVGARLAPDATEGGLGVADNLRAARLLESLGLIDFVDISLGNYQSFPKMIGGMHEPVGYELATSIPVGQGVSVPRLVIGRFRTLEEADLVVRAGDADMVGFTRAHIADPELVNKSLAGRVEEVRPCIACNQGCVGQLLVAPYRLGCVVNPAAGFESTLGEDKLQIAPLQQRILVIGGGPSGMEAARIAALRGHHVTLAEATGALGGTINIAARAPTRRGIADIVMWQAATLERLGVTIHYNTYVDLNDAILDEFDSIIVATGASPRMDGVQMSNPGEPVRGFEHDKVVSSRMLLTDRSREWGRSAVIIDDAGHYEGIAAAEYLVSMGLDVAYVSRHVAFAPGVESSLMTEPALERLSRGQFSVHLRTRAIEVDDEGVLIGPTYLPVGSNRVKRLPADTVVFVSVDRPNRVLADGLLNWGVRVQVVGDAQSPRYLGRAIREGWLAGATA